MLRGNKLMSWGVDWRRESGQRARRMGANYELCYVRKQMLDRETRRLIVVVIAKLPIRHAAM